MALAIKRHKDDEIPIGAIKIPRELALQYQRGIIRNWEPYSEVLAIKIGPGILGGVTAISSVTILRHFRAKLKLKAEGKVTSYLPTVVIPTFFAALVHSTFIQPKILLNEYDCPLCIQTRATLYQVASGFLYPYALAPMASFMFAVRHFSVRLPYINEDPKAWLKLFIKLTRKSKSLAGYVFAVNVIAAMIITPWEMSQTLNIHQKLQEHDKLVDSGLITELN